MDDSPERRLARKPEKVSCHALAYHSLAARAVRQIIDRFRAGSVEQFLLGMVDEKVLTMQQIRRLMEKVKKRK